MSHAGDLRSWRKEDFEQMKVIERAVIQVLLPLIENRNPLLAMFALIRCARVMLRKGDAAAQKELLPVIDAYMRGKTGPPGESPIWLPFTGSVN